MKKAFINILNKLPYIRGLYLQNKKMLQAKLELEQKLFYPPGHYYSTIVDVYLIKKYELNIWKKPAENSIEGIDLNAEQQIGLMGELSNYYAEMPFIAKKQNELRYYFENDFFCHSDGILLYSLIRHFKPKRIIEIGSGFSSAVMLDTNELFFNNEIDLTFIEPFPERLYSAIKENDKKSTTIIVSEVQQVSLERFEELNAGDILFIDSSHVVKTGSDVCFILFEILPKLKSGVIIHFHDIFYPFEYLREWVLEGRNWNEDYFLKAFLMYNNEFKIMLFPDYLHKLYENSFIQMPLCYENTGGSLWITKK